MSVLTGALGSLAPKLLQLLHDEYKLQKGVRKQVQWLHSELDSIYAFLDEVSEVPWDRLNGQIKVWVREVREASYDMEDVLDTYLVRIDGGEPADPSRLKRAMKKMGKVFTKAKARRGIAGAIADIKKYLEEISERRQRYKLDQIMSKQDSTALKIDPRLKAMYKEMTQLIGTDKSSEDVISLLNPSDTENDLFNKKIMKKVSIVGVGGLGKTTLAKAVYDKLRSQYDCGAFVSVGRDHDLSTVLKDILFFLDKYKYHKIHTTGRGVDLLINELREFLENKRYFLVVDDVWDVEICKMIRLALIENDGSNVITTTRKFDVARKAGEVYKLKPLSFENSKKLFYARIFGADGQYRDTQPCDVSDKILKRCDGIPLSIITMASLLAGKPKDEWSKLYNSIGFRHKDNTDVEDTMTVISFSYYDMPSHLQTCLLYLSTYPEDHNIGKNELIWKWLAEGFIHEKQGERLFELGERYFSDLINRSMIQANVEKDGSVLGCRVHDIVLDLLRKISSEENFIAVLDGNTEAMSPLSNVRRFALHKRNIEHVSSEAKVVHMPKVRSYTAIGCHINNNLVHIPSFRLVRVLDFRGCRIEEGCHFEHLGDLLHLRYLRIACGGTDPMLPKQITNLKLIQTLVLYGHMPGSIVLPTQLLHLCSWNVPDNIGKLSSLQDLSLSGVPKKFVMELSNLRELRVLSINIRGGMDKSMQRDFVVSMSNLLKIQKIDIDTLGFINVDTAMWEAAGFVLPRSLNHLNLVNCFCLSKLPSCINPSRLPNLSYLRLWVHSMVEEDFKQLAKLPVLSCLHLHINSTITASIINAGGNDGWFQKLRYFMINVMVQLQQCNKEDSCISLHIWNREGALPFGSGKSNCSKNVPSAVMPNLEVLRFLIPLRALMDNNDDCGNIGLEYLPSIHELRVGIDCDGVSSEDVDAALAALRNTCEVHPNHPTPDTYRYNEEKMVSTKDKEAEKEQEADMASHAVNNIDSGKLSPSCS